MPETSAKRLSPAVWVVLPVLLVFMYAYPRVLIAWLGIDSPWTNYLYHYGFGVIFFGVGVTLVLRERSCQPARPRDALWLRVLVGGLIGYLVVHAAWILLALRMPFFGD